MKLSPLSELKLITSWVNVFSSLIQLIFATRLGNKLSIPFVIEESVKDFSLASFKANINARSGVLMLCAHSQRDTGNASFSEKDQNNPLTTFFGAPYWQRPRAAAYSDFLRPARVNYEQYELTRST